MMPRPDGGAYRVLLPMAGAAHDPNRMHVMLNLPPAPPPPNRLTVDQVAKLARVDPTRVRQWIRNGDTSAGQPTFLEASRVGKSYTITREAWEAFDQARRAKRVAPVIPADYVPFVRVFGQALGHWVATGNGSRLRRPAEGRPALCQLGRTHEWAAPGRALAGTRRTHATTVCVVHGHLHKVFGVAAERVYCGRKSHFSRGCHGYSNFEQDAREVFESDVAISHVVAALEAEAEVWLRSAAAVAALNTIGWCLVRRPNLPEHDVSDTFRKAVEKHGRPSSPREIPGGA